MHIRKDCLNSYSMYSSNKNMHKTEKFRNYLNFKSIVNLMINFNILQLDLFFFRKMTLLLAEL